MGSRQYLTLLEAARLLRVEPRTLAEWARRGDVPALKTPGGQWRFHPGDLILALRPARDTPTKGTTSGDGGE